MAIERLTPQDGEWTGHSLQAHQYGCMQLHAALHNNQPCNIVDLYDPCRTGGMRKPVPEVTPIVQQPWDRDISPRRQEREREALERKGYDQRTEKASQSTYETLINRQRSPELNASTPTITPSAPITAKEAVSQTAREVAHTAKDTYDEARTIATSIYREEQDAQRQLEKEFNFKPHNVIQNTVDEYKSAIIAPQKTIVGSAICGAASLVAAVAVCNLTAYQADLYDLEAKRLAKRVSSEEGWFKPAATVIHSATSFKDYAGAVLESKAYERTAKQEARTEREQQKAEISTKREQIEEKYQTQKAEIGRRSDRETADYNHQMQKLDGDIARIYNSSQVQEYNRTRQEKIQNATTTFEHNKAVINENRALALDRIDRSTPIAAAQIREVNRQYDTKIATLESNHSKNISRINSTYDDRVKVLTNQADKKVADIVAQKTALTQRHQAAQAEFKSQLAGAKKERDTMVQATRHEVAKVRNDYKTAKETIKVNAHNRSAELQTIFSGNWAEMKENKANRAVAKAAKHGAEGAFELKQILVTKQFALAQYLVNNTGTEQDKQLMTAFLQDKKNEQQSRDAGVPFTHTMRKLSAEDTKAAEALMAKFGASGLSSIKGNADVVKFLEAKVPELQALAIQKNEAWTNAKLTVDKLKTDQKALLAKAGGKAENLSATDKKKLEQIKTSLASAVKAEKVAKKDAQEGKAMVKAAKQQKKDIKKHSELLAKLGDKAKPVKRPNYSMYKKASAHLARSLTLSLAALNRMAQQNNAIIGADHQFQAKMKKLADYTDFAARTIQRTATVGKMATKMVLGVGKLSGKVLIIIASKSKAFQARRDSLLKFAAKHGKLMKVLNKTGNVVGRGVRLGKNAVGKAMFLPGQLIRLSSMSILDMPAMIEQKMLSWTVKGGVAMAKVGGKIVVKSAAFVTRPFAKMGARAGKAVGRAIGTGVRTAVGGVGRLLGKGLGGAVRFVGKGVGGAGRFAGRGVATLARRTIGSSPLWGKIKQLGGAALGFLKQAGGFLLNIGKILTDPFKALGAIAAKFLSFIFTGLTTIIGGFLSIIWWLVGQLVTIAFGAMFWLLIVIMLLSVLDAIYEFFMQFTTERRILINEDPSYIMNLGANYRNVELSIVEFFSEKKGASNNEGYKQGIECNNDPIYYAVFNNSFRWFGIIDQEGGKDINYKLSNGVFKRHYNHNAYESYETYFGHLRNLQEQGLIKKLEVQKPTFLETLRDWIAGLCNAAASFLENLQAEIGVAVARDQGTFGNSFWEELPAEVIQNVQTGRFRTQVTTYDKVDVSYYEGTSASHVPTASNFEISNAKDAMAMMDAIYTMDSDMTRIKALRYLGVGEFQLTCHEEPITSIKDADNLDNLFWKTHDIQYTDGVKADHIVFHPQDANNLNQIATVPQNPSDPYYGILNMQCQNRSTIYFTYKRQDHADKDPNCVVWKDPDPTTITKLGTWGDLDLHGNGWVYFPESLHDVSGYWDQSPDGSWRYIVTNTRVYCNTIHDDSGYRCWWDIKGSVDGDLYIKYGTASITYTYTPTNYWYTPNQCPHTYPEQTEEFNFCMGHARLAANIYVAVGKNTSGYPSIYDQAAQLGAKNYQIGNALFTWSKDLDVRGWGPAPAEYIDPHDEWTDSGLVSLAQGKCEEPLEYQGAADDITQLVTKHGNATGPQYLVAHEAGSDVLYHILYYKENVFYASDLMAGEQEDIEVKKDPGDINARVGVSMGLDIVKLSIKKSANGVFYPLVTSY